MKQNDQSGGKLQVCVLEEGMRPVPNALVRVTERSAGKTVAELATDSSGQTPAVELAAPLEEYSAEYTAARPYETYGVTVRAEGFETLHLSGVQIFPQSTALQGVKLRAAASNGFHVRNVAIGPHALWGDYPAKIPEDEVKPLPETGGFVVLDRPVIPEFIIVHLGRPADASAKDVWVPFKDYIKNVASSEIYPTWRSEAIKANVLAIISFTLNRVYTEWYRGKGYDFTITNTTAYDQAFVDGRNIYEEISVVVDDLFTTYVTREGIDQPLFTQYCDGRRSQCSGLTQWGTQALGEQGYSAIEILKHFYGSDIYLAAAEKVEGVPRSYGGSVLQMGSSGGDVQTIQTQINKIATHFPAIPKVRDDAQFGAETRKSVEEFQRIFHLPVTGSVDFATWYEISNIFVGITRMSEPG